MTQAPYANASKAPAQLVVPGTVKLRAAIGLRRQCYELVRPGERRADFYQATGARPTTSRHVRRRSAKSCRRATAGVR